MSIWQAIFVNRKTTASVPAQSFLFKQQPYGDIIKHKVNSIKQYQSAVFSICRVVHLSSLIPVYFHHTPKKSCTHQQTLPFYLLPKPLIFLQGTGLFLGGRQKDPQDILPSVTMNHLGGSKVQRKLFQWGERKGKNRREINPHIFILKNKLASFIIRVLQTLCINTCMWNLEKQYRR